MQDRIYKFRAWNKEEKIMISIGISLSEYSQEPYILMQFTGLKDKNGKREIYEGDIVREWLVEDHPSDLTYKVGFDRGHFTLTCIQNGYDRMGIWNVNNNIEVIGNIYENHELLK